MKTTRTFYPADRYVYEFGLCSFRNGFAQVDTGQDASYFGTWANPFKLIIFTYCEGDCTTVECDTPEEFVAELQAIKKWNEESGHGFRGIDPMCDYDVEGKFLALNIGELLH